MFDKLWDFIIEMWQKFIPCYIIKQYDMGVRLRLGKFHSVLSPGLTYKLPFVDEIITNQVVWTTMNLPPQSLVTLDEKNIVISVVVKYRVTDIKTYLLEVYDASDAISDMTQGTVKKLVTSRDWQDCKSNKLETELTNKAKSEAAKWGIEITTVTIANLGMIRSIRLFNDSTIVD